MAHVLLLLTKYKYLILLPIAIIEGPFTSIVVGFLATIKVFNVFLAYVIIVSGDMIGDSFFYCLGRWSHHFILRHGSRVGITAEKLENAKKYFANYHHRALIMSKLVYGVGISGLVAAGALKISFKKYIKTCFFIALSQSAILLLVGFFFGSAYLKIGKYLNIYGTVISIAVLFLVGLLIFRAVRKNIRFKNERK